MGETDITTTTTTTTTTITVPKVVPVPSAGPASLPLYEEVGRVPDWHKMPSEVRLSGSMPKNRTQDELTDEMAKRYMMRDGYVLTPTARLARDRVLRSIRMEEEERNAWLQGNTSLEDVVRVYYRSWEQDRIARDTRRRLEHFDRLCRTLAGDPLMSAQDKMRVLWRFNRNYVADIQIYEQTVLPGLKSDKEKGEIRRMLRRFEDMVSYVEDGWKGDQQLRHLGFGADSAHQQMFGREADLLTGVSNRVRQIGAHADGNRQPAAAGGQIADRDRWAGEVDATLTDAQRTAIHRTDDWLIGVGLDSTKRLPFISRIMSLSQRERLFMYYLVEKGKLAAPGILEIADSQTDYVPNVDKVSWSMTRIPFRLWEKFSKDGLVRHHWGKLESALALVNRQEVRLAIGQFARVAQKETPKDRTKADVNTQARMAFEDQLKKTIRAVEAAQQAIETRDSAWIYRKKKKDAARQMIRSAQQELTTLFAMHRQLKGPVAAAEERDMDALIHGPTLQPGYNSEDKGLLHYTAKTGEESAKVLAKGAVIPTFYSDEIEAIGKPALADKTDPMVGDVNLSKLLDGVYYTAGALTTARSLMGLISALKGAHRTYQLWMTGDVSSANSTLMALRSGVGIINSAGGMALGITALSYAARVRDGMLAGTMETLKGMQTGVADAGAVMSALSLGVDIADLTVQARNQHHRDLAREKLLNLKYSGTLHGDDEKYMTGIMKLDGRNKAKKLTGTVFSMANNVTGIVGAVTGPVGSLSCLGVSLAINIIGKCVDHGLHERNLGKTAEEFLQLEDMGDLLEQSCGLSHQEVQGILRDQKKTSELKKRLMNHMAAELGFTTFRSLYRHIAGRYAAFLHRKMFYDSNGQPILAGQEGGNAEVVACQEIVRGLGLKVTYPSTNDEAQAQRQRHPGVERIAAMLGG